MEINQIKRIIKEELPSLINQDINLRNWVIEVSMPHFADKVTMENRFNRLMEELRLDREESTRKWEANQKEIRSLMEDIKNLNKNPLWWKKGRLK